MTLVPAGRARSSNIVTALPLSGLIRRREFMRYIRRRARGCGAGRRARRHGSRPLHRHGPCARQHVAQRRDPGGGPPSPNQSAAATPIARRRRHHRDHAVQRALLPLLDDRGLQRQQDRALHVPLPVRLRRRLGRRPHLREPRRPLFFMAFLLRAGLPLAQIFLLAAAILALRAARTPRRARAFCCFSPTAGFKSGAATAVGFWLRTGQRFSVQED